MSNSTIPIKEFQLDLSELTYTGHDLVRPESILAKPNGTLWVSDGRGGVTRIDPDSQQTFLAGLGGEPNGLAMADDGSILSPIPAQAPSRSFIPMDILKNSSQRSKASN